MFTSQSSLLKLETIQKRALGFVLDDYASDYYDLQKESWCTWDENNGIEIFGDWGIQMY